MTETVDFEEAHDSPGTVVPWGILAWVWACVLAFPPLVLIAAAHILGGPPGLIAAVLSCSPGLGFSVYAIVRYGQERRFSAGLWVPWAGAFTSLALMAIIAGYMTKGKALEDRQRADYLGCYASMELIGQELTRYIAEHGDAPRSLEDLDMSAFPGGGVPRCAAHDGEGTGYEYVPANFCRGEGWQILLYDSEPRHLTHSHIRGLRLFCRQDGRIIGLAEETFEQLLANPAEAARNALWGRGDDGVGDEVEVNR